MPLPPSKVKPPFPIYSHFPSSLERRWYRSANWLSNKLYPFPSPLAAAGVIGAAAWNTRGNALMDLLPKSGVQGVEIAKIAAVSVLTVYLPIVFVRALLKRVYYGYKGYMFENTKKPSLTTKLWAILRKIVSLAPLRLKSADELLPNMPVPSLESTMEKYLASMKHILTEEEFATISDQAAQFVKEEGRKLQMYAKLYSWTTDNYVTAFWKKYAYLYWKDPLMITSSVAHVDVKKPADATRAYRCAHIAFIEVRSQMAIDKEQYLALGGGLLCTRHYENMYAMTRIPSEDCDYLQKNGISPYVVVLSGGRFYRVDVFNPKTRKAYSIEQLTKMFEHIEDQPAIDGLDSKVAALTFDKRDQWARNRKKFFLDHPENKKTLQLIEDAVFVLIFQDDEYSSEELSTYLKSMLTGNGWDRWVDKSLNYIVSKNAKAGGTTEHSIADGAEFDHIMENFITFEKDILSYPPIEQQRNITLSPEQEKEIAWPTELPVHVNDEMRSEITRILAVHDERSSDVDFCANFFSEFGKGVIKKCGCSPDAFVQMAIQLANYRDQGHFSLTYEAASVRFFANSRTETLRSVSDESCDFVKAMQDSNVEKSEKIRLLRAACERHVANNKECMVGRGIDRHLFVLFVLSKGMGVSSAFLDNYISQKWALSTSHVPNVTGQNDEDTNIGDSWQGACFGAVSPTGYGVCYRFAGNHSIVCHVSSYKSAENTDSTRFSAAIFDAAREITQLFDL